MANQPRVLYAHHPPASKEAERARDPTRGPNGWPRGPRSWPQAPRLGAIARRWLLGPRLTSCPQGQLNHRRYSLSGTLANSRTCFPRSTAIAPCPLTDQRHTAGLARPGDPHRGAGRPRPPDLPADRHWSPRATGVDAPGRRSAQAGLAPGWPAGLAALIITPFASRRRTCAASPTARAQPGSADGPTRTAQGRRVGADELSDPASATLSAPPRKRPTRAAWHPTTVAPPKWAGSTLQPRAVGRRPAELADDADPYATVEQEQRAPRCSLPMRAGGATPR